MATRLTITPAAQKFLGRIVRFSGLPATAGVRLLVSAGGCSGYNAEFSAEAAPQPGDEVLAAGGTQLFLPAESRLLLDGATMDFVDTPTKSGLSFTHPQQSACACSSAQPAAPGVATVAVGAIGRGRPASLNP